MFYLLPECTVVPVALWYSLLDTKNNYLADILISVICTVIKNKKICFQALNVHLKKRNVFIYLHIATYRHTHMRREINA